MNLRASIDPGKHVLPWCAWSELSLLVAAGVSVAPEHLRSMHARAHWHAMNVRYQLGQQGFVGVSFSHVWVEQMRLTKNQEKTLPLAIGRGNDLLEIQGIACYVAGRLTGFEGGFTLLPPGTWKGHATKKATKNRLFGIPGHPGILQPAEQHVLLRALEGVAPSLHHNLFDAAGIGTAGTGRYLIRGAA